MRVLLKLVLDCSPDDAWRAVRSPEIFEAASAPFTTFESLEVGGYPELWEEGPHPVAVKALGLVEIGDQIIDVSFAQKADATGRYVRLMRDDGGGLSGPLALITRWEHTMAIAAAPGGRTLYRDRLVFEAGALTPLLWPLYWAFWQWRGIRLKQLAATF
jgi:hypothetical protein